MLELDQFGPRLGALTDDEDAEVRLHALRAVNRVGLNATKFANARLQDDDEKVRRAAARIIAE